MEQMRATWTDSRLDDLKDQVTVIDGKVTKLGARMDDGFARADRRLDDSTARLDQRMDHGIARMDDGFARLDGRIDKLHHTLVQLMAGLIGSIIVLMVALIGIVATHV